MVTEFRVSVPGMDVIVLPINNTHIKMHSSGAAETPGESGTRPCGQCGRGCSLGKDRALGAERGALSPCEYSNVIIARRTPWQDSEDVWRPACPHCLHGLLKPGAGRCGLFLTPSLKSTLIRT